MPIWTSNARGRAQDRRTNSQRTAAPTVVAFALRVLRSPSTTRRFGAGLWVSQMASTYNQALVAHYETFLDLSPLGQRLWGAILHSPDLTTCGLMVWSPNFRKRLAAGIGTTSRALDKAAVDLASHGLVRLATDADVLAVCHLVSAASRLRGKVAQGALSEMRRLPDCEDASQLREMLEGGSKQLRSSQQTTSKQLRTPAPALALTPTVNPPTPRKRGTNKRLKEVVSIWTEVIAGTDHVKPRPGAGLTAQWEKLLRSKTTGKSARDYTDDQWREGFRYVARCKWVNGGYDGPTKRLNLAQFFQPSFWAKMDGRSWDADDPVSQTFDFDEINALFRGEA